MVGQCASGHSAEVAFQVERCGGVPYFLAMKRNIRRWIPAILAPVLVAGTAIGFSVSANAAIDLPDKSASEILQLINTNPEIAFSGKVTKKAQ